MQKLCLDVILILSPSCTAAVIKITPFTSTQVCGYSFMQMSFKP
jgi:hypothetical protein